MPASCSRMVGADWEDDNSGWERKDWNDDQRKDWSDDQRKDWNDDQRKHWKDDQGWNEGQDWSTHKPAGCLRKA